ncbi:cyanoexosortase C [Leptolyngbya sp. CCNP1308]|uniref:cyanoexosortase C n=1 Tax=Leptolyngbya sp. CCNP1308 TaxID=3110255 RepID=UPI002B1F11F3|nr:cyanoexosortase C [Leptolyngbya sp. CCNP1308]MEA5448607.1 cyanoexosortase C [Leptolyngbya sp. CCNP1308]
MKAQHYLKLAGLWIISLAKDYHGRFILLGLSIGLFYFPIWVGYLVPKALRGKVGWFLIACMLLLAGAELWSRRQVLQNLKASAEDQLLGHLMIVFGAVLFPFCRFDIWPQAFLWLIILAGMACSTWGASIFTKFVLPSIFIGITTYPRIGLISRFIWDFITPYQFLEIKMAQASSLAMQAIGFPATHQGVYITFPEGAVQVGWGCNGLDMALSIAATGLFMGILYKQNRVQMAILIVIAMVVSLAFNIPRLMLVTLAHVYWGPWWFDFWHGFWGGQIFVGLLLTLYYYVMMAMIERNKARPNASH